MRALTLWRPWPSAVFIPDPMKQKDVENRTWRPPASALGHDIVIHAARKWHARSVDYLARETGVRFRMDDCPAGAVVGVVRLAGFLDGDRWVSASDAFDDRQAVQIARQSPWWIRDQVGWVLRDARPLPEPVVVGGQRRLWTLPKDVEAAVRSQLG